MTRTIPGPFSWLLKSDLEKIRSSFDDSSQIATSMLVYVGLAELASNSGDVGLLTASHAKIGAMVGLCSKTVFRRLHDLESIGVISISTPKLKAPSTYTLRRYELIAQRSDSESKRTDSESKRSDFQIESKVLLSTVRNKEGKKRSRSIPAKPLTTAQRIGYENQAKLLKEKIQKHKDRGYYEWERTPEWLATKDELEQALSKVESRLLEVTL